MKTFVTAMIVAAMALSFGACSETYHAERTKSNWDGSRTHEDVTVREGPGGAVSVDKEVTRTR